MPTSVQQSGFQCKVLLTNMFYNVFIFYLFMQQSHKVKGVTVKDGIVNIGLNNKNDILIKWDFNGMLETNIFKRHLFLCITHKQDLFNLTFKLLQSCYQNFKNGDLYTMSMLTTSKLEWFQKSKIDHCKCTYFNAKNKWSHSAIDIVESVLKTCAKFKEPTFVFIVKDSNVRIENIELLIRKLRDQINLTSLFMIYTPNHHQNLIDFSTGICQLSSDLSEIQKFYKHYSQHIACIEAELIIDSLSGNFLAKGKHWKNIQFWAIKRKIYYPLANNLYDIMETFRLCSAKKEAWDFKLTLNYTLLNGNKYACSQNLSINVGSDVDANSPFKFKQNFHRSFILCEGVQLTENPFETYSILQPNL